MRTPTEAFRERAHGGSKRNAGMRPDSCQGKVNAFSLAAPSVSSKEVEMTHSIGYVRKSKSEQFQPSVELSLRTDTSNPNHHLWNNNGTWFACYTLCEPGCSGFRRRVSLKTHSVSEARIRRDNLFAFQKGGAK